MSSDLTFFPFGFLVFAVFFSTLFIESARRLLLQLLLLRTMMTVRSGDSRSGSGSGSGAGTGPEAVEIRPLVIHIAYFYACRQATIFLFCFLVSFFWNTQLQAHAVACARYTFSHSHTYKRSAHHTYAHTGTGERIAAANATRLRRHFPNFLSFSKRASEDAVCN